MDISATKVINGSLQFGTASIPVPTCGNGLPISPTGWIVKLREMWFKEASGMGWPLLPATSSSLSIWPTTQVGCRKIQGGWELIRAPDL
jgi:hypothetical protein